MNIWNKLTMATRAGALAFQRTFSNPEAEHMRRTFQNKAAQYRYLWAWFNSTALEDLEMWSSYRQKYKMYRQTRIIYNPVRRLVDFYAENVYPGVLAETNVGIPPGVPLAIPFPQDMDPALRSAIAQIWEWSRWASGKTVMVRWGAALGNAFVEIVDSPANNKVYLINRWPGQVVDLSLDDVGNVKGYVLEYEAEDENGRGYTYRKEVNQDFFATFKDDKPFAYQDGVEAKYDNPYGFVPSVWIPHRHLGGIYGGAAIQGSIGKLEELNGLASMAHDQVRKLLASPKMLWTNASMDELFALAGTKRGKTDSLSPEGLDREAFPFLIGPEGGNVDDLSSNLDLGDAMLYIESLMDEIESDHPELKMFEELRKMSQVTGPAAFRLAADVSNRIFEAAANYDRGSVALFQMSVAIAGERLRRGDWQGVTAQQRKFDGFDLQSYERGDLDIRILPRPLLESTERDFAEKEQLLWTAAAQAVDKSAVPFEFLMEHWEWSEDKKASYRKIRDENDKRQLTQQEEQMKMVQKLAPPPVPGAGGAGPETTANKPAGSSATERPTPATPKKESK